MLVLEIKQVEMSCKGSFVNLDKETMTGFASALKSLFGNILLLEGLDHVKSLVLCYRFRC